jgi:hypothetical protein
MRPWARLSIETMVGCVTPIIAAMVRWDMPERRRAPASDGPSGSAGLTQPTIVALERSFVGRIESLELVLHRLHLVPRLIPHSPGVPASMEQSDISDDVIEFLATPQSSAVCPFEASNA